MEELLKNPYVIKALQSVALALVVMVLAKVAMSFAAKRRKKTSEAPFAIKYTALAFFAVALLFIWLEGLGPVLTALTIVAAALTIVSKELILNFLGSFVIFWREIFAIGDRVQVGEHYGDVIDKGILYFTLLETGQIESTGHSTGRLIKVPNALALTLPVINATRGAGYVWNEFDIAVSGTSDWEKGAEHLLSLVDKYYEQERIDLNRIKQVFEKKGIFFNRMEPRTYIDIDSGNIRITLRYLCRSRLARESKDFIITRFLKDIQSIGIELAGD